MAGSPPHRGSDETGVLASRQAIPEAQHPRVTEPTARSVAARSNAQDVAIVDADATVLDALKVMAERDTGAVAVMSPVGLVGIFTERDHARNALLGNRTAANTPVVDLVPGPPATVAPGDGLGRCLAELAERRATHLAVVDAGRVVGLLAEADLLAARVAHHQRIFHETEMDQKLLFLRGTYSC
ncbi:CBS domain-containing protein [Siculibacillus lacustris]|nr:CBS domain-containing protein [Siculibacillus lacustris]